MESAITTWSVDRLNLSNRDALVVEITGKHLLITSNKRIINILRKVAMWLP
jgi:hypothetical protein